MPATEPTDNISPDAILHDTLQSLDDKITLLAQEFDEAENKLVYYQKQVTATGSVLSATRQMRDTLLNVANSDAVSSNIIPGKIAVPVNSR